MYADEFFHNRFLVSDILPGPLNHQKVISLFTKNPRGDQETSFLYEDEKHDLFNAAINCVALHPVLTNIVKIRELEDYDYTGKLTLDSPILPKSIKRIICVSDRTGNSDNRGGGCGDLEFPVESFYWEQRFSKQITIFDVTCILYRMKGSKYDWWYELYTGFIEIRKGHTLFLKVKFDYGS